MTAMSAVNRMSAMNKVHGINRNNAMSAVNRMNAMNVINRIHAMNAMNKIHAMNAMSAVNEMEEQEAFRSNCPIYGNPKQPSTRHNRMESQTVESSQERNGKRPKEQPLRRRCLR